MVVDFNSPLAGKTIVYEVTVRKKLEKAGEKLMALLKRRVAGLPEDKVKVRVVKSVATITLPYEFLGVEMIQYSLLGFVNDVNELLPEVKTAKIVFEAEFKREKEGEVKPPEEVAEQKLEQTAETQAQ